MRQFLSTTGITLSLLIPSSLSLLTAPSSPCAASCGNSTTTLGSEIVCDDSDYDTTETGALFRNCIECELNSTYVAANGESDTQWLLYNLRYAMSYCLWGYPDNDDALDTPCITSRACGPLESNIQYDDLSSNATEYGYCANIDTEFVPKCSDCLAELGTEYYMNNFFSVVEGACNIQPAAGTLLTVTGSIFAYDDVNVTTPSSIPTYSTGSGGLSQGAEIGIAVGSICFVIAVAGFLIVFFGKRRRRAYLKTIRDRQNGLTGGPGYGGSAYGDNSSMSQTPQTPQVSALGWQMHGGGHYPGSPTVSGMDDSPASDAAILGGWHNQPGPYGKEKLGFSPYSSQYSSPVDAHGRPLNQQQWAHGEQARGLGIDSQMEQQHEQQGLDGEGEAIEMQRMNEAEAWVREAERRGFTTSPVPAAPPAPMLGHPGFGRGAPQGSFLGAARHEEEGEVGTPGKAI